MPTMSPNPLEPAVGPIRPPLGAVLGLLRLATNLRCKAMIDTGASCSFISKDMIARLGKVDMIYMPLTVSLGGGSQSNQFLLLLKVPAWYMSCKISY
jgi:hypothetical protein